MPTPPIAKRIPHVEVIHGDRRHDDYYWLRDQNDPDVLGYLAAENAYTDAMLKPTEAFQEALYRELLGRIKEDDASVPYRFGAGYYYSRTEKGKQYPIHCRRVSSLDAPEQVTVDLNALAIGRDFLALGAYAVSDDGRYLAYSLDYTGFREYTLQVKDLVLETLAAERIEKVSTVAWSAEGATFFYVTEDQAKRPYRLWRHRLGTPVSDDVLLYEETDQLFRLHVWRSRSRALVFAASASFTATEIRYLHADRPAEPWIMIRPREREHEYYVDHGIGPGGDVFYIRTNDGRRRNFRLVTAPMAAPGQWTEVLAHRDDVMLDDVDVFADHYVVHEREDGLVRLRVTELASGIVHHIEMPEVIYDVEAEGNAEFAVSEYRFRYQSLTTPASVYDYDVPGRRLTLRKRTEVLGGYDPARYQAERLHATAPDGTRVAISVVTLKDAPRDGSAPLLLTGYGAYGISYPTTFSSSRLSLLDRGVSFAIAHVRGGGELGKRWHDEGRMLAKPNTFTDFIAAAETLIRTGLTSADRLVIEGGSAGGLLIGAVLNRRPELARAGVLRVPFVDVINTMLDESLPLTVGEFEEWGNPKLREHYEVMKAYCPYTNLHPARWPSMLVRTSFHDSQVMYWEPAKYVARLRTLKLDERPLLFKINLAAGHGGASGRYDYLREIAFDYAFILTELGRAY